MKTILEIAMDSPDQSLIATVYAYVYNPCIWESAFAVESLHFTKAGAYAAKRRAMLAEYQEWDEERERYGKNGRIRGRGRKVSRDTAHEIWEYTIQQ